jgi:hypothetical protein
MVIGHWLSPQPKRCELCKDEFPWAELQLLDGHQVCRGCARLVRDEGIMLPESLDKSSINPNKVPGNK